MGPGVSRVGRVALWFCASLSWSDAAVIVLTCLGDLGVRAALHFSFLRPHGLLWGHCDSVNVLGLSPFYGKVWL